MKYVEKKQYEKSWEKPRFAVFSTLLVLLYHVPEASRHNKKTEGTEKDGHFTNMIWIEIYQCFNVIYQWKLLQNYCKSFNLAKFWHSKNIIHYSLKNFDSTRYHNQGLHPWKLPHWQDFKTQRRVTGIPKRIGDENWCQLSSHYKNTVRIVITQTKSPLIQ